MRYSKLFGKTTKNVSAEETSINAKLLTRGGYIRRELAGVYNYLPLGLRVIEKINKVVREEMDAADAQELELSSLQNKDSWIQTNRWDLFDALFKVISQYKHEYALGPTHEEVISPLASQFISSYKDLPVHVYQIQTKFRDEARAKSGILRGREFLMKDLYSFHATEEDFKAYYEIMKKTYMKVFERVGLTAIETQASGGAFSDVSHEYQVITPAGEDEIIYCPGGDFSANTEVSPVQEGKQCELGHGVLKRAKTIEVGNIFPLGTKFSDAFNITYKDANGVEKKVLMGCYGIGITRLMGTIVEVHHDERGIVWPDSVAPYKVHLLTLANQDPEIMDKGEALYHSLHDMGVEILWDDRDISPGEKFTDADLLGIPVRLVISKKSEGKIEWKNRHESKTDLLSSDEIFKAFSK
jgi:prolyl-tRNA synthetase